MSSSAVEPTDKVDPVDGAADPPPAGGATPTRRSFGQAMLGVPDLGAAAIGLVFLVESLRPSLLPRPPVVQGVLTALSLLIGYGIAGLVLLVFRAQRKRTGWFIVGDQVRRIGRLLLAVAAGIALVAGPIVWYRWQNSQRDLVAMPRIPVTAIASMLVAAIIVTVVLLAVSRLVAFVVGRGDRFLVARIGAVAAHVIVAVVVVVLSVGLTNRVVLHGVFNRTDAAFSAGDRSTEPGVTRPTTAEQSGGPESLVPWGSLGQQGRTFVAGATTPAKLRAFAGPKASVKQPIRVYVGLESAKTARARAALAVAELERTGAFKRRVLVVATVTGTGWINPVAASAVEFLQHGDSAIVGVQYSYLPSWISFLVDEHKAAETGKALNDAVYAAWSKLPAATRPKLVVFGESLGSFGSESAYHGVDATASVDTVTGRSSGVLWVAPTNANPVRAQVTSERDAGSPVWLPVYQGGKRVRFVDAPGQLPISQPGDPSSITYLQHPSDPVTWWELSTLWRRPAWTRPPMGTDVPSQAGWFPIVTWLQTTGDLIEGFSTPPGHGHNYNDAFAAGFASLVAPPGWTKADTARLDRMLAGEKAGESSY